MPRLRIPTRLLRGLLGREEVALHHAAIAVALAAGIVIGGALGGRTIIAERTAAVYPDAYANYATGAAVDCSWACPSASTIRAGGWRGVLRYLSYDNGKNITSAQATDYRSHGLALALNWESTADHALSGYSGGVSDARQALTEANAVGYPSNGVVYFSVDFDATECEQATIDSYFAGAASVLGESRVGAYGGYYPLARTVTGACAAPSLEASGHVRYFWQTTAWSGGALVPGRVLYQDLYGVLGGTSDGDGILGAWGAWLPDGSVLTSNSNPTPAPPPATSPPPAAPACSFGSSSWSIKPWPNGDGGQSMTVYKAGGSIACPNAELSFGLQYVNKYTGQRFNVGWDPFTSRTSDYWALAYYTTPCSDGYRVYHFMIALRSGSGRIVAYKQVGSWAINSDCA